MSRPGCLVPAKERSSRMQCRLAAAAALHHAAPAAVWQVGRTVAGGTAVRVAAVPVCQGQYREEHGVGVLATAAGRCQFQVPRDTTGCAEMAET